ncbi:MAG TPA: GAF domain-containing SpoIIE family protein phosphatase [Longimicrobiales bacterium]
MNTQALLELAPLPAAITALIDSFAASHNCTDVRVWGRSGGEWLCVHPRGDVDYNAIATGMRYPVELNDGAELEIQVDGGDVRDADMRFLAETVRQALSYEREARLAARELSERYEEINLLYFISEILASVLSVPDAAHWILAEVADVLGARRASLWVIHADDRRLHLAAAVGEDGSSGPIDVNDPDSATAWVFREKQSLNIERGGQHVRPKVLEPRPQGREAFLSVPINYTPPEGGTRTIGVITLVGRKSNVRFSAGDARLLAAIASQVGAALETQRLVQESLKQERMVRELELAHDLQLKLLPDSDKFNDGAAQVAAWCAPAESVGGDFYQLFRLSGDRLGVMIGDVSSHGFSAALIMALTMSAAAIYAQESAPPATVLQRIHQALIKELESTEMYLTLFYCVLDPHARQLTYANAGHPHAFRISADGTVRRLGATDPPLGMSPFEQYGEDLVAWGADEDLLVLFTDGLSDAFCAKSGVGGEKNLIAEIVANRHRAPKDILKRLFKTAERATLNIPPDDRTAVLVRG